MMCSIAESVARLVARPMLTAAEREAMFVLLREHFDGVTHEQFDRDLAEKNWVILLAREERLVGFSTLLAYETVFENLPVSVICSGDTIVAPEAWGSTALARAWIEAVNELRRAYPRGPYYWLLLTSGFRTYRFLPVFWRNFHPRFDGPIPIQHKRLLDYLARERFGRQYDPSTGVVRFSNPQRLRNELQLIPPGRISDPHVAFFVQRNGGHADGDELVCLCELSADNLTAAGRRMIAPRSHGLHSVHG